MKGKLRAFVLEDDPNRVEGFRAALDAYSVADFAISVEDAIRTFEPPYDVICLDHDLGGETMVDSGHANTGYQFVRWLVEHQTRLVGDCVVFVHSWNPDGAARMTRALDEAGWSVMKHQFSGSLLLMLTKITRPDHSQAGER